MLVSISDQNRAGVSRRVPARLPRLQIILDDLKKKMGGVWYFRESPAQEPTQTVVKIIKGVIDAITSRELPVRLQPEDYEISELSPSPDRGELSLLERQ